MHEGAKVDVKALWEKFSAWRGASLARRIVVSVAGFSLLTCLAIGVMSLVAVSIARAVLPSTEGAAAQASASAGAEGGDPESAVAQAGGNRTGGAATRTDATRRGPRAAKTPKALPSDPTAKDEEDE